MDKLKAKWKTKENKELTFTPNIGKKKEDGESFGADGTSYGYNLNKTNSRVESRNSSNNSSKREWKNTTHLSNTS